jgi:predicted GTPase
MASMSGTNVDMNEAEMMSIKNKAKTNSSSTPAVVKKIAIVGLPNTGKSQIFNNLTGKYTLVANYSHPITTLATIPPSHNCPKDCGKMQV